LKKVKKNWSHQELKYASSHYYENVRHQVERQTLNYWNLSDKLPDRRLLNDKLTALFEPCHARQYGRVSFETRISMGGSIATSFYHYKQFAKGTCSCLHLT